MMGIVLPHARVPIVKGASGILAFDAAEAHVAEAGPCIRCGSCTRACPMGLLPLEMASRIGADDLAGAAGFGLSDCIGCGCCAYVCPSHIPLVQYFSYAKGELSARERSKLRNDATRRLAEERVARLEREARDKAAAAARRKADRDAAKAAAGAGTRPVPVRVVKPTSEAAT
jgi:electron transport complex protein RnfC